MGLFSRSRMPVATSPLGMVRKGMKRADPDKLRNPLPDQRYNEVLIKVDQALELLFHGACGRNVYTARHNNGFITVDVYAAWVHVYYVETWRAGGQLADHYRTMGYRVEVHPCQDDPCSIELLIIPPKEFRFFA